MIERIDAALAGLEAEGGDAFPPLAGVVRELRWCRGYLLGERVGDMPGPLTMGLVATRELELYGDNPELAAEVYEIERALLERLPR